MSAELMTEMLAMQVKFLGMVPARLDVANELLAQTPSRESTMALHRLLHEISGSAGMSGCREVHADLRAAVVPAKIADTDDRILSPAELRAIEAHLASTRRHLAGDNE